MTNTVQKRSYEIDCLRILAAFLVVTIHVSATHFYINPSRGAWIAMNAYDSIAHIAVPLFFMISGAMFLKKPTLDVKRFISKNYLSLVVIFLFWNTLYSFYSITYHFDTVSVFFTDEWIRKFVHSFAKGSIHLWYLKAAIIVYPFIPIIHAAIHGSKCDIRYWMLAISLACIPMIVSSSTMNLLPDSFYTFIESFKISYLGYIFYIILGYILYSEKRYSKVSTIALILSFIAIAGTSVIINAYFSQAKGEALTLLYGNHSINIIIESSILFLLFVKLGLKKLTWHNTVIISSLSGLTLGIYLIHPMMITFLDDAGINCFIFNAWLSIPLVSILVFSISAGIAFILKRIPGINKVV